VKEQDPTVAIFCANLQRMRALACQLALAREIRNAFVHDYPDRHPKKAAAYNAAWRFSDYLLEVAENLEAYSRRHHGKALCD